MKKCIGCGNILQNENKEEKGYTSKNINDVKYCERCFKIKNYGEYKFEDISVNDYKRIFSDINNSDNLVLFFVDILFIDDSINLINKYINNKVILVITKKDLLPSSLKEEKIKKYLKQYNLTNVIDTFVISSKKNYNIDKLYNKINEYNNNNKEIYIVGNSNSGKSTFINKILYNYTDYTDYLTVSYILNTTLKVNKIKITDNLVLIDTPGIINEGNIINNLDKKNIKKIIPKKTIKPRTYQLDMGDTIYANDLFRLEYVKGAKNSFTIFIANDIIINRINTVTNLRGKNFSKKEIHLTGKQDVIVNGLCFIKVIGEAYINLYTIDNVKVSVRNSLI